MTRSLDNVAYEAALAEASRLTKERSGPVDLRDLVGKAIKVYLARVPK